MVATGTAPAEATTSPGAVVRAARGAQAVWRARPLAERLRVLRAARRHLVARADALADAAGRAGSAGRAETLAAELIPWADALRYLEREAPRILKPRSMRRMQILREPLGVVAVIAPGNYPLFLPGVQVAQALVAGNAVLLKPAPGTEAAAQAIRALFLDAGLPPDALAVLPADVETARAMLAEGVDHVVLTGSATTGRAVLADLAPTLASSTMELSGCDAVFVQADADLDLVVRALRFGLAFNGSRTCIAPRRVFVPRGLEAELLERLTAAIRDVPATRLDAATRTLVARLAGEAVSEGARIAIGDVPDAGSMRPLVLAGVRPDMEIAASDVFAPVLSLLAVEDDDDALAQAARCPYALGASVFGSARAAWALAERAPAGVVVVNDLIAPTADPRVPFGGRGESGFGVTRGADGLLGLTTPKTVVASKGGRRRHLDALQAGADRLLLALLRATHGAGVGERIAAFRALAREGARYGRASRDEEDTNDEREP